MKQIILFFFFICLGIKANAQTANVDTALKFEKSIITCEKQWVVIKKADTALYYSFGYVYIDGEEIIFQKEGTFKIGKRNKYILNAVDENKKFDKQPIHSHTSFMLFSRRLPLVALLANRHFKELKIIDEPDWVKPYYTYTDTVEHNYRWGSIYLDEYNDSLGIPYLEKIYKIYPHYAGVKLDMDKYDVFFSSRGLEAKLASAYGGDKGIEILNNAIKYNPNNATFYMLLGGAYEKKMLRNEAIDAFKRGISIIPGEKSDQKYWFAGVISNIYEKLKNKEEQVKWRALSDAYNPHPGRVF